MRVSRRKFTILIILFFAILAILIVMYILKLPVNVNTTKLNINQPAIKYDNNSILFSNGRSFVIYNFRSGAIKSIGPDRKLPSEIRDISISKNKRYLLFVAQRQYYDDSLGEKLIKDNLDTNEPRWWIYDSETNDFFYLPSETISATFDKSNNDNSVISIERDIELGGEDEGSYVGFLQSFVLPEFKKIDGEKTKDFVDIKSTDVGLYAQNNSQDLFNLDYATGKAALISSEIGAYSPSLSTKYIVYKSLEKNNSESLHLLNVENKKIRTLSNNIGSHNLSALWSDNGNSVYFAKSSKTISNQAVSGKSSKDLRLVDYSSGEDPTVVGVFNDKELLIKDDANLYIASNEQVALPKEPSNFYVKLQNNTIIEYDESSKTFLVSVDTNEDITQQQKEEVYNQLKRDGFEPLFWNIRFTTTEV